MRYQQKNEGKCRKNRKVVGGRGSIKKNKSENPSNSAPKCSVHQVPSVGKASRERKSVKSVEWFLHLKLISRKLTGLMAPCVCECDRYVCVCVRCCCWCVSSSDASTSAQLSCECDKNLNQIESKCCICDSYLHTTPVCVCVLVCVCTWI